MGYGHESNESENKRFHDACEVAGLDESEIDRFSEVYHQRPRDERERMTFREIRIEAAEWKLDHGSGFRRSDR